MMICSIYPKDAEANAINYGTLDRDEIPCDPHDVANCKHDAASNSYKRGCDPATGCRG